MITERAFAFDSFRIDNFVVKGFRTDFTEKLTFTTIVIVEIDVGCPTVGAGDSVGNFVFRIFMSSNRLKFLAVLMQMFSQKLFVIKLFNSFKFRERINLHLSINLINRWSFYLVF